MKKIFFLLVAIISLAVVHSTGEVSFTDIFQEKFPKRPSPAVPENSAAHGVDDVTGLLEHLGNPFADIYPDGDAVYARNVWDLQRFAGRIFIGAGNSSNIGPGPNAGPVEIKIYDPDTGEFSVEGIVDEEQIDVYRILDRKLCIPGHDPTQSWKFGNFYCRDDAGAWTKFRNIPQGLHTYDMAWFKGDLYAALGTAGGGAILRSGDGGRSWSVIYEGNRRVYSFLQVSDSLFGVSSFATGVSKVKGSGGHLFSSLVKKLSGLLEGHDDFPYAVKLKKMISGSGDTSVHGMTEVTGNAGAVPRRDIGIPEIFPDTPLAPNKYAKIIRPLAVGDKAIYIGAYIHNDHQSMPFGLYIAASPLSGEISAKRISLPGSLVPWDFLVEKDILYVLAGNHDGRDALIQVLTAPFAEPYRPVEIFRFHYPSFARSFEVVNGDFYFGIGCEVKNPKSYTLDEIVPQTGNILRLKRQWIRSGFAGQVQ